MLNKENPTFGKISQVTGSRKAELPVPLVPDSAPGVFEQVVINNPDTSHVENYEGLKKAIRVTGMWLIGWAIFSAINGNVTWPIVLVITSLMSFYFYDVAQMFLVYAGVLFWAAAWNIILSGDPLWIIMGVIQLACAVFTIREYRKYKSAKTVYRSKVVLGGLSSTTHRESRMAWIALIFGGIALVGLVGFIPAGIALNLVNSSSFEDLIGTILMILMELGALGLPVGIAALASGSRPKAAAAIGLGLGALSLVLEFVIVFIGSTL